MAQVQKTTTKNTQERERERKGRKKTSLQYNEHLFISSEHIPLIFTEKNEFFKQYIQVYFFVHRVKALSHSRIIHLQNARQAAHCILNIHRLQEHTCPISLPEKLTSTFTFKVRCIVHTCACVSTHAHSHTHKRSTSCLRITSL